MANGSDTNGDWLSWALKQGFAAALLVFLSWYLLTQIVTPMRDNSQRLTDSIIGTNQKHADAAVTNAAANQAHAINEAEIAITMRDTKQILQQIRDDQRSGAWNKK